MSIYPMVSAGGRKKGFSLILVFLLMISPRDAYAYLDPGTGSYIIQILIAAVVGGAFVMKQYFHRIKALLKNVFSKKEKA